MDREQHPPWHGGAKARRDRSDVHKDKSRQQRRSNIGTPAQIIASSSSGFQRILTVKVSRVISPIAYLHCKDHEYQEERLCKGWLLADEVASLGSHFNSRYLEFDVDIPTPRNVTFSCKSAE